MRINFEKVIIHNFLSYDHSEINLSDKGYCLVSGVNNDKRDNSLSNGSGKSSWSSAICWALTGQTIQGKKNGLKNIYVDENSCYVTLYFSVDNNKFIITRYKEPKSDLKIFVNGEDKSGKGIKESEVVLAEYLPDLTSELIASIIILGQGLPLKFTNNSPSGRKEVLEKLSKSDFMIQDIKNRLTKVISNNNSDLRKVDDELLTLTTKEDMYNSQLTTLENTLSDLNKPRNFQVEIDSLSNTISELETLNNAKLISVEDNTKKLNSYNEILNNLLIEKNKLQEKENSEFDTYKTDYFNKKTDMSNTMMTYKNNLTIELNNYNSSATTEFMQVKGNYESEIKSLKVEISKLQSITDVCPTCGQKIPGVIKVDTADKEVELKALVEALNVEIVKYNSNIADRKKQYDSDIIELNNSYNSSVKVIETEYDEKVSIHNNLLKSIDDKFKLDSAQVTLDIAEVNKLISALNSEINLNNSKLLSYKTELNKLKLEFDNHIKKINDTTSEISLLKNSLEDLRNKKLYNNNEKIMISNRLAIDKKIETLIKRDFRGFLLSNVINFINAKCKEYSEDIFGNSALEFYLDGNNIEITYLQKSFENLSGGEKQKVDLIIQFAIRDMMSKYLDFSCNIFILDEIFDNLDVLGCNNVLNLISRKLNDIESMFIISHHADTLEIPYDCEMIIVKDQYGISKVK